MSKNPNVKRFRVIPNVGIEDTLTGEIMTTQLEYCHALNRQDEFRNELAERFWKYKKEVKEWK